MKVRARKPAAERKKEIVETAIRLAALCGPDRLTTENLAAEIGISQPAIFRHFATKSEIWVAVGKHINDLMEENADLIEATSPKDLMRQLMTFHLTFIEATPAVPAILFSRELHSENEQLRAFFSNLMVERQEYIASLITAGQELGEFNSAINALDAANSLLALVQGLAMQWSLNNMNFDLVAEGQKMLKIQFLGLAKR